MRRLLDSEDRPIAIVGVVLCVAVLMYLALHFIVAEPQATTVNPTSPAPCQEDMECWDCGSMGNMICGNFEDAKASADRCGGTVYFHKENMFTTVCPV